METNRKKCWLYTTPTKDVCPIQVEGRGNRIRIGTKLAGMVSDRPGGKQWPQRTGGGDVCAKEATRRRVQRQRELGSERGWRVVSKRKEARREREMHLRRNVRDRWLSPALKMKVQTHNARLVESWIAKRIPCVDREFVRGPSIRDQVVETNSRAIAVTVHLCRVANTFLSNQCVFENHSMHRFFRTRRKRHRFFACTRTIFPMHAKKTSSNANFRKVVHL
eukprot:scaffold2639_cov361-Pavlova_lutheri.AAC.30